VPDAGADPGSEEEAPVKTPLELAAERARANLRNRGWRVEPLTWEEVEVLLEHVKMPYEIRELVNDAVDAGYEDGYAVGSGAA
jgi:hypothetical protein